MAALVALALADQVALHCFRVRRPVLPPVAGVIAAPLAGAVATDLAILGIRNQFLSAAVGAATLLAGRLRAHRLVRMASRRLELQVAITAAPLNHPYRVKATQGGYSSEK
jgi:hypothetical protein